MWRKYQEMSKFFEFINENQLVKFELLIDRTSSIYLKSEIKGFRFCNSFFFFDKILHKLCLMGPSTASP
jgi:hypothetical protein